MSTSQPCLDEYLFSASQIIELSRSAGPYVFLAGDRRLTLHDIRYLSQLGRGAFGQVMKCRIRGGLEYVAVKIIEIPGELPEAVKNEIRVLISLRSPYTVRHICSFIQFGRVCIVMELVEGGTLKDLIEHCVHYPTRVLMPNRLLFKWSREIAAALKELHDLRLIHRDVKPANVMITGSVYLEPSPKGDPAMKLGDLGLARILSDETMRAQTKCGTPLYMAPEQVAFSGGYTEKVDVWALGCIMYELLTLRPPFVARNSQDLFRAILYEDPCARMPIRANPDFWALIKACLSKEPARRPAMGEVIERLNRAEIELRRKALAPTTRGRISAR